MSLIEFVNRSTAATLSLGLSKSLLAQPSLAGACCASTRPASRRPHTAADHSLNQQGDLAMRMVDGNPSYLLRETMSQSAAREQFWSRDFFSAARYGQSVEPNRQSLRRIIGAVDPRAAAQPPQLIANFGQPAELAHAPGYKVYAIRWRVFDPVTADSDGMHAEGLLLQPEQQVARVVALPDADCTPEMLTGLAPGLPPAAQFARLVAEHEKSRSSFPFSSAATTSPNPRHRHDQHAAPRVDLSHGLRNRPPHHRLRMPDCFFAYRLVRAAELPAQAAHRRYRLWRRWPAAHSGALDTRIDATAVSGYFQPREALWAEPIYRDLWGLLRESAMRSSPASSLPAASSSRPAALLKFPLRRRPPTAVSPAPVPTARSPLHRPAPSARSSIAPPHSSSQAERLRPSPFRCERWRPRPSRLHRRAPGFSPVPRPARPARARSHRAPRRQRAHSIRRVRPPARRLTASLIRFVDFTQALIRKSPDVRQLFWKMPTPHPSPRGNNSTEFYRNYIWISIIGRMPVPPGRPTAHPLHSR